MIVVGQLREVRDAYARRDYGVQLWTALFFGAMLRRAS